MEVDKQYDVVKYFLDYTWEEPRVNTIVGEYWSASQSTDPGSHQQNLPLQQPVQFQGFLEG
jgi:hypothetical protein